MKTLDKDNNGFVSIEEFSACLKTLNVFISKHEEHCLLRKFDTNGDGKVSMEEFYNCLASNFWFKRNIKWLKTYSYSLQKKNIQRTLKST